MSDQRPPVPRYGEYADPETVRAAGGGGAAVPLAAPAEPPAPASRRPDVVATVALLALGLIGTLIAVTFAPALPEALQQQYDLYGLGDHEPTSALPVVQWTIVISHVVLFLAALAIAVPRLQRGRVAFWVPLTTGVIATVVFWGALTALLASDQRLVEAVAGF